MNDINWHQSEVSGRLWTFCVSVRVDEELPVGGSTDFHRAEVNKGRVQKNSCICNYTRFPAYIY